MDHFINSSSVNKEKDESPDFKLLLNRIVSDWWVILVSLIVCMCIVYSVLQYSVPMYKINAKLLIEDEKKGGAGLNVNDIFGDLGGMFNVKNNVDNEAEILKSRSMMEKVVKGLNLNIAYYREGRIKNQQMLESPFVVDLISVNDSISRTAFKLSLHENSIQLAYRETKTNIDVEQSLKYEQSILINGIGIIKIKKNPKVAFQPGNYVFVITSIDEVVALLQKETSINVTNKFVTTIDLSLNYPLPLKGEIILGRLIDEYIAQNVNDKNKITDSTIAFIENRLLYVGRELGDIEGNIQNFKQGNKLADLTEQSKQLVTNTGDIVKQLATIETQINVIDALEETLKNEDKNKRVMPSSVLPQDLVFGKLVENYNLLLLERDRQTVASTEENPFIKNLDERIITLRNTILTNLANSKKTFLINKTQLLKDIAKLESGIHDIPSQERTYLDLARQQKIKQELYLFLLQKREEMAISKTSSISHSKIIDAPKSDYKPFGPNKLLICIIGLLCSATLPFLRIYILDILNNKVQSKEEISKLTSVPVLGEIAHNESEKTLVITKDSRSPIAEQFRALRTNLQFFMNGQKNKTILLTSSMSGEGKSFSAANLGAILAISGKKVLMMELDLRKPNLSASLGIKNNVGFTNYIITPEIKYSEIIFPSGAHENLSIISSGPLPPNPAETLLSERMEELMMKLKEEYDYIILDAPPIGLVADAQLLNKYATLTLYLVRQKYTMKAQLEIPDELYRNSKMANIGIVLNGVKKSQRYGGYGSYGTYGNEPGKKSWTQRFTLGLIKFKS